jgi:hypothetical protein
VLHPQVIGGDANPEGRANEYEQAVQAPTGCAWRMNGADEKNEAHGDKRQALEDAQRARLYAELELHEVRISEQCHADDESG